VSADERQEFEEEFGYVGWTRLRDGYMNPIAQAKWQAWQARGRLLEEENRQCYCCQESGCQPGCRCELLAGKGRKVGAPDAT